MGHTVWPKNVSESGPYVPYFCRLLLLFEHRLVCMSNEDSFVSVKKILFLDHICKYQVENIFRAIETPYDIMGYMKAILSQGSY